MPLLAPSARVTLNGHLGQSEVFSTGWWLAGALPASQAAADTAAATWASNTTFTTALAGLSGFLSPDGAYDNARIYFYANPGAPAVFISQVSIGSLAGTGGRAVPYQTAIVASLRSATLTRSGRGRMYLPANGVTLTNNQLTSSQCATTAAWVRNCISSSAAALLTASPTGIVMSTKTAAVQPLTRIIVDSRPDIQRRRAGKETVLFTGTVSYP